MADKKILVVDDVMATREGIASIIDRVPGATVAAISEKAPATMDMVKQHQYDLALIDLQLGDENGIVLGRHLLEIDPELKIVIYTKEASVVIAAEVFRHEYHTSSARRAALQLVGPDSNPETRAIRLTYPTTGLHGYTLLKNITPLSLLRNLDTLAQNGRVVDPEILDLLLDRLNRHRLTPREMHCCELISWGKSNREISLQLGISQQAVENLVNSLYSKLAITGEPKDPGRRVLLALTMQRWRGLATYDDLIKTKSG